MPKLQNRVPGYRKHKATGQAVVTINGRDIYLGKFNSAKSRTEYNRLIAEWTAGHGTLTAPSTDLTVAELLAAFLKHADRYYGPAKGDPNSEVHRFIAAMRWVKQLYGRTPIEQFGPIALKAVRQKMIEADWARTYINHSVNRIRHIFKWGVENEIVPETTLRALQAVSPLRFGKTDARETEPIKPVPDAFVDEVLRFVSPPVAAMIELQRVTGMRSGEVTIMRGCDISMTGKVWIYTPATHKTAYRGHRRQVYLGPKAQEIIRPFLKADLQAYLFSPRDAVRARFEKSARLRKTPLSCGNRAGTNRKKNPAKLPGERYDTMGYRQAVDYGIQAANRARIKAAAEQGIEEKDVALVPHWHPHQLRHNAATNLRREHGIEIARIILGHRSAAITEVYAEVDHARAIDVMAKIG